MEQTVTSYKQQHYRLFGGFRSRHPTLSRIGRNLAITGAITAPLAILGHRNIKAAKALRYTRKIGKLRQGVALMNRGKRLTRAAWMIGLPGAVISIANPLERHSYENKRWKEALQRPTHTTHVIERRRGKPNIYRDIYS